MNRLVAGALFVSVSLFCPPAHAAVDPAAIMNEAIAVNGRDGLDAALQYLRDAIEADRADGTADPAIAAVYSMLAEAILGQGDAAEAMRLVDEGLALARSAPEPDAETVADLTGDRGTILEATGDAAGAIAAYRESIALFDQTFGKLPEINRLRLPLAALFDAAGRWDEAIAVRRDVLAALEGRDDADASIAAWRALALALRNVERFDETLAAHESYLAAVESLRPPDHPDRLSALNAMAAFLLDANRIDQAMPLLAEAVPLADAVGEAALASAQVHQNLSFAYHHLNRFADAEAELRRADAMWEKFGSSQQILRAQNLNSLTNLLSDLGRLDEALAVSDQAMALVRGYEHFSSGIPLNTHDVRASLLVLAQRPTEAAEVSRNSLAGWLAIRDQDSEPVIIARQNLASVLVRLGDYDEARKLVDAALASAKRTMPPDSQVLGLVYSTLGTILGDTGDLPGSVGAYEASLAIWQKTVAGTIREARALANLAVAKSRLGEDADTEALLRRAVAIYEVAAPFHPDLDNAYSNLATLLRDQGRVEEAVALSRRSLARAEAAGEDRLATATALYDLAFALYLSRGYAEAEPLLVRALAIQKRHLPGKHMLIANTMNNLGLVLWELGRYEESGELAADALLMREAVLPENHPHIAASLGNIATIFDAAGQIERAEVFYRRAMTMVEGIYGRDHPDYIVKAANLATMLYAQAHRPDEALDIFRDVVARLARMSEKQATISAGASQRLQSVRTVFTNYVGAAWAAADADGRRP